MRTKTLDVRAQRTRRSLHRAFASLIEGAQYEALTIADITDRAGISRSTFYAHFAGKDALLAGSIAGPFAVLADTIALGYSEGGLVRLLDHFWGNRAQARGLLRGSARRKAVEVLVRLIEERLRVVALHRRGALILPPRMVAIQLSEVLLAPIGAWLLGESRCTSAELAAGLRRASIAALDALRRLPPPI